MQFLVAQAGPQLLDYLKNRLEADASALVSIPPILPFFPVGGISIFRPLHIRYETDEVGEKVLLFHCRSNRGVVVVFIFALVPGAPPDTVRNDVYVCFFRKV